MMNVNIISLKLKNNIACCRNMKSLIKNKSKIATCLEKLLTAN